ncbi:MAG: 5'-nucleotidase, lipoprotein e(P4) family [Acidobacteriota bacterium]
MTHLKPRAAHTGLTLLVGLVLGLGLGSSSGTTAWGQRDITPRINPQERALDANLFMQTSAEYAACCLQTYAWASERLRQRLAALPPLEQPPAVILDLDETVLDNAGFQSFLDREGKTYEKALWERWERGFVTEMRLVPGAKGFIEEAERAGVTVVYISNRTDREATVAALRHNGLSVEGIADRLFLRTDTADKTARRKAIEARYRVLLYIGDNLRDFSETFVTPELSPDADDNARQQALAKRRTVVEQQAYRFGTDWFILPNPVYGEWQVALGDKPRRFLRPTAMNSNP